MSNSLELYYCKCLTLPCIFRHYRHKIRWIKQKHTLLNILLGHCNRPNFRNTPINSYKLTYRWIISFYHILPHNLPLPYRYIPITRLTFRIKTAIFLYLALLLQTYNISQCIRNNQVRLVHRTRDPVHTLPNFRYTISFGLDIVMFIYTYF